MSAPLHVVGLSGGKDSVAMALALKEREPRDYTWICNATGNELPEMVEHFATLERLLGGPIRYVGAGVDLYQLILQQKMIPNFRSRFCTRMLKIEPTITFFETLPEGSVLYVGLRADEEARRGLYGEDVAVRFPMREWGWSLVDVWQFLNERGIKIPKRTDCGVCPYQRLGEWWDLWKHHPDEFWRGAFVEDLFGHTFRSEQRDTWPASLSLRPGGRVRTRPDPQRRQPGARPLRQPHHRLPSVHAMNLLPSEAAARLRLTVGTLANWRVTGEGPPYIKFGRKVLYPLAQIEKFENDHLRTATSVRPGLLPGDQSS